jgi:lipid-binding SYLF domain-containing protein
MLDRVVHDEVHATLAWLKTKDPALPALLDKSYGYAVFPAMGRAGVVVGGATGGGEVFERGQPVGLAKLSQLTVGVQVGGHTFSELVLFDNKESLDSFKKGKVSFTANASAVLVKAAATGTSGAHTRAYSRGGMLLELSLGGQKFRFIPHDFEFLKETEGAEKEGGAGASAGAAAEPELGPEHEAEGAQPAPQEPAETPVSGTVGARERGRIARSARRMIGAASSRAADFLESHGKDGGRVDRLTSMFTHKDGGGALKKAQFLLAGLGKEASLAPALGREVQAALGRMEEKRPGLREAIERAYGYAVFPSVGRASAVVGGAYGRGEVFEHGKLIGYAAIAQMTIGVQLGGETFDELILFDDAGALERFKSGKIAFAANASVAIVKAGAAATSDYAAATRVYLHSEGGLILETALGGQKFIFRPKFLGD